MICPYCKKENFVTGLVFMNAENYENKVFIVDCLKCGEKIRVIAQRQVIISYVTKTSEHEDYSF